MATTDLYQQALERSTKLVEGVTVFLRQLCKLVDCPPLQNVAEVVHAEELRQAGTDGWVRRQSSNPFTRAR
jgi:hypothetical protein